MEKTNYDYLTEDLKFLGFGEALNQSLSEKMAEGAAAFELYFAVTIDERPVDAILYFNKPVPGGYYFFSGYQLGLEEKSHHIKIFKGRGITLKEGYNLLSGRAVFKQLMGKNGQKYDAWIQLDLGAKEGENFKVNSYYAIHGYDLSACLDQLPIEVPSPNWDRAMLLKSLQKGNLQAAILRLDNQMKRVLIQANPKERTITVLEEVPEKETAGHLDHDQARES